MALGYIGTHSVNWHKTGERMLHPFTPLRRCTVVGLREIVVGKKRSRKSLKQWTVFYSTWPSKTPFTTRSSVICDVIKPLFSYKRLCRETNTYRIRKYGQSLLQGVLYTTTIQKSLSTRPYFKENHWRPYSQNGRNKFWSIMSQKKKLKSLKINFILYVSLFTYSVVSIHSGIYWYQNGQKL